MEMIIYSIVSVKEDSGKLDSILSRMKGISEANLFTIEYDKIAAIVSEIKKVDLVADKSNALIYAGIVETLYQQFTLIPMRFGSVMDSSAMITRMLEINYQEIQHNLSMVENKCEFGLKVFCDSDKLAAELAGKQNDTIVSSNSDPEIKYSVYREWVNKKLKEHRLEESRSAYIDSIIAEIKEYIDQINAISKFKKVASLTNIIDALFLLEKAKQSELIQTVEDLQKRYAGLNFVLTGPWPPYSFVETTIK